MKVNQEFRPQSGQWQCAICQAPLQPGQAELYYLENTFSVRVLVCPKCELALIPEDMATGKMLEVEQLLEDK
jgi:hypothetical protein